jgi:hypothetical protein
MVEENLRSWFREETGMTVLNKEGEETLENEVGEDEEEVEPFRRVRHFQFVK